MGIISNAHGFDISGLSIIISHCTDNLVVGNI